MERMGRCSRQEERRVGCECSRPTHRLACKPRSEARHTTSSSHALFKVPSHARLTPPDVDYPSAFGNNPAALIVADIVTWRSPVEVAGRGSHSFPLYESNPCHAPAAEKLQAQ